MCANSGPITSNIVTRISVTKCVGICIIFVAASARPSNLSLSLSFCWVYQDQAETKLGVTSLEAKPMEPYQTKFVETRLALIKLTVQIFFVFKIDG